MSMYKPSDARTDFNKSATRVASLQLKAPERCQQERKICLADSNKLYPACINLASKLLDDGLSAHRGHVDHDRVFE